VNRRLGVTAVPRPESGVPKTPASGRTGQAEGTGRAGSAGGLHAFRRLLLASLLLPLLLFSALAMYDRTQSLRATKRDLLATLDTLHGHAERVFEFQALALGAVAERLRGRTQAEILADAPAHHAYLRALRDHTRGVLGLVVFDADGRPVVDSDRFPAPGGIDVSDREYFRWHRDRPGSEPFVSSPVRSRAASGAPTFFVSVRRPDVQGGGGFAGVIATGIRQASFAGYWDRAVPDPDASVVLFRRDGTILARRPPIDPETSPRFPPEAPVMQAVASGREREVIQGTSPIDRTDRFVAYRRVERFPEIFIAHGVSRSNALGPFHRRLWIYGAFAAATALALSWLTLLARRRTADLLGEVAERRRAEVALRDLAVTLERRVEERTAEVRAGEARFRGLLENSPEKMWVNRPDGSVEWFNAAWRAYTGQAAVPAGAEWAEAVHPEDRPRMLALRTQALAAGRGYEVQLRLRRSEDGGWRWHRGKVAPMRDAGDGITAWVGTAADIHDIREAEARFRDTFEQAAVGVAHVGLDGKWLRVNGRLCAMLGYREADILAKTFQDLTHPEDLDTDLAQLHRLLAGEIATYSMEKRYLRADGSELWVELTVSLRRGEGTGAPMHFISVIQDISDRKAVEAALRESEARLRIATDTARVGLVVLERDPDGEPRYRFANPAYSEVLGLQESLIGRRVSDVLGPVYKAVLKPRIDGAFAGERVNFEWTLPPAGERRPEERHLLGTFDPVRDETGEPLVAVVVADITDRARAQAALQRLTEDLERRVEERTRRLAEVNRELEDFAHSVAHDLRAPLRTMHGFAMALGEDYAEALDDAGRDYIARIMRGAARLDELIRDLLAYSRITREEVEIERVDLDGVAAEVLAQLRATIEEKGAVVSVGRPLPAVLGHPAVLSQLLLNLLSNALKFVGPGVRPKVQIRSESRPGNRIRLWVEDNGIGIAPSHAARIFEVFQRLHGAEEYPGTGIGLAIVRRGAERLGGSAGVVSEPGAGSRFWIELRTPEERTR
jgi:PAS domain S-box-containing protein